MTDETNRTETADRPADDRTAASAETTRSDAGGGGASDGGANDDGAGGSGAGGDGTVDRLTTALNYAVLAGLLLLALVAAVQLYLSVSRTVTTFVVYEYRAPVLAAFNLVVLLVAALGISLQLRRLRGGDADA